MTKYIILHGPPRSGKTLNAQALKQHYNCDHVFDGFAVNSRVIGIGGLVLIITCNAAIKGPKGNRRLFKDSVRIPVAEAAIALGEKWIGHFPAVAPALANCPFCGSGETNKFSYDGPEKQVRMSTVPPSEKAPRLYLAYCDTCGASGPISEYESEAVRLWNVRDLVQGVLQ